MGTILTIASLLMAAQPHRATVYGFGEMNCGNIGNPKPCMVGAFTATGDRFDPALATAAIPAPTKFRFKAFIVKIKDYMGRCRSIRVNDKSNPRWIGKRGLDLTPAAVELLTGKPAHRRWSGKLEFCK